MPQFIRYIITMTHYHWTCGYNGCCSSSGYKVYAEDTQPEKIGYTCAYEDTDWDWNKDYDITLKKAVNSIEKKLGRPAVLDKDYKIIDTDEDSDVESDAVVDKYLES
jgi:hypothetical protein